MIIMSLYAIFRITRRLLLTLVAVCFCLQTQADSRPWTFWYWMYGAVSKPAIQADLKGMKAVGLGGCYLMPIRGVAERPEYGGQAQQLSPTFWEMIDYALQQSDSLSLGMGIHICDGFALAGGPWIAPEESMQQVVWTDTLLHIAPITNHQQARKTVGKRQRTVAAPLAPLPLPQKHAGFQGYYRDIAAFAVKVHEPLPTPHEGGSIVRDEKGVFRSKVAGHIDYSFDQPQEVRALHIVPSGNNVQSQRLRIEASDDGIHYRLVRQLTPPRQGWQNTDADYTYSLPATRARHFRFTWTPEGSEPGSEDLDAAKWAPKLKIRQLTLLADDRIDQYESRNGCVWRIAQQLIAPNDYPEVIPLSADGTPQQPLSAGTWRIIRMGHTATGHTNATAGGGKGLECDKFSAAAVDKQISHWFGKFMQRPHANVIKYMHIDSWECGSQNWSASFAEEFRQRRGYDIMPFLPVFAGIPMPGNEQVLRDIRQTIDDLIHEVFFATAQRRAHQYGVQLSSESVAPTMVSDGIRHYRYADLPMGEYWLNSPTHDKFCDMLDAISGAHIYGKNIVQAEGFTEVRGVWNETPAMIKPLFDHNLALGMNRLFFHVNTHNPWLDRRPGMTLDGIGLFFQRDQTWYGEAKGMVGYITRCQELMQQGQPVTDIAVFTGDVLPSRALTPDRLVTILPGLMGAERVAAEQRRLANEGLPMAESPVGVRHSAGIVSPSDWVNPLRGYHYDSMNSDALLHQPFHYSTLVIPQSVAIANTAKARIDALRQQGVTIINKPYLADTLSRVGRDALLPLGIAFAHRQTTDRDIYFLANQQDSARHFVASLRCTKGTPHLYDPLTDRHYAASFEKKQGRTLVDVTLDAHGSVFVIFSADNSFAAKPVATTTKPIDGKTWEMHFKENNIRLSEAKLFDWTTSANDSIRYYSGTATYTTTFRLAAKRGSRVVLRLPQVSDVAHVWVNGKDCGIAWTAPYEVDITDALQRGRNTLRIDVTNTWHNALRGNDMGKAPFAGIWTNARYRTKGDALLPAGLLATPLLRISHQK